MRNHGGHLQEELFGYNSGTVTRSINQGEITGAIRVNGGIVGRNKRNSVLLL